MHYWLKGMDAPGRRHDCELKNAVSLVDNPPGRRRHSRQWFSVFHKCKCTRRWSFQTTRNIITTTSI